VLADVHLATRATGTWKVYHRTEALLERAIADVNGRDVDHVVFPGDLTKDAEPWNFARFDELTAELDAPAVAIPGNHDVPKAKYDHDVPSVREFAERYADGDYPFVRAVGDLTLVGLNTETLPDGSLADAWEGAVSAAQLDALDAALGDADTPVVFAHHNLARQPEHPDHPEWTRFALRDPGPLQAVLAAHDAPLLFSAHHHVPAATTVDGIREVVAPAVCSFPNAYLLVEVDRTGTTVYMVPLATREELATSYVSGRDGTYHGQGITRLVADRLRSLPLADETD
jgi:3',5'-cyclic AMP phosphodiesterase CpdA